MGEERPAGVCRAGARCPRRMSSTATRREAAARARRRRIRYRAPPPTAGAHRGGVVPRGPVVHRPRAPLRMGTRPPAMFELRHARLHTLIFHQSLPAARSRPCMCMRRLLRHTTGFWGCQDAYVLALSAQTDILPSIVQILPDRLRRCLADFVQLLRFVQQSDSAWPQSANLGRTWPNLARTCPSSTKSGQVCPNLPSYGELLRNLAENGPNRPDIASRSNFWQLSDNCLATLGQLRTWRPVWPGQLSAKCGEQSLGNS